MQIEQNRTAEFLSSEASGTRSREIITVAMGEVIGAGAVLGKLTATGQYVVLDPVAAVPPDGSEIAAAIAYEAVDATGAATSVTAIVRDAEVYTDLLVFADAVIAGDKTAAIAGLATAGIIAR